MKQTEPKASQLTEALWDTETTARFVGKSTKSLESDRLKNIGIPYIRLGRAVRYDPAIVRAYVAKRIVRTADSEAAA